MPTESAQIAFDQQKLRRWTWKLLEEYESICYQYRLKLPRPTLEVVESKSFWGRWDPAYRKIEISADLIVNCCWDTVVNTLKHEIAHQIVSEQFADVSDHGKEFQEACALIGVPLEFRRASGDFPRKIEHWKDADEQSDARLLKKVEKLFALASSTNENEAALAMERAHQVLAKHNIESYSDLQNEDFVYLIVNSGKKKINGYQYRICSILREHYFVKIIYSDQYNAKTDSTYKTIEILGRKENVLIAEYVFDYLLRTLEVMWKSYRKVHPDYQYKKRSYLIGVLAGFEAKLEQMKVNTDRPAQQRDLLVLQDQKLDSFVRERFPRTVSGRIGSGRFDGNVFDQGARDGRTIVINKGLTDTAHKGKSRFLLS